jgi:regulator of sigma E protease
MEGLGFGLLAFALFILILGGLVLIHELGHFLTAKAFNVRVLEFGFGFPPRAKVLRSKGETLLTLNWLPIGGFVRMEGEDGDNADDPRSFAAQKLRVKMTILVAGVVLNIVLAFLIFFGLALAASPAFTLRIGEVQAGSPAAGAGLVPGDQIVEIGGERLDYLQWPIATEALRSRAGQTVPLLIERADGSTVTVTVTLRPPEQLSDQVGALGIGRTEVVLGKGYVGHGVGESAQIASREVVRWGGLIISGLGQLVDGLIKDPTAPPPAAGPIGIAVSLAEIFNTAGPIMTLYVAAILSVNLGVVNILPFPPLDGGRMFVLLLKRLFGARVSLRAERVTYAVGFVVLMAFILWISGFDIARLGAGSTP